MGSARSDGNTAHVVRRLLKTAPGSRLLDLNGMNIAPFDYAVLERDDDFHVVVASLLKAPAVVFATPVYWYAMSGPMKIVFDRLTDLLLTPGGRSRGRALAGRDVWVLATGTDPEAPGCFIEPFRLTAEYFAMHYRGICYVPCAKDSPPTEDALRRVDEFAAGLPGG